MFARWTIDPLYDNLLAINNSKSLRNSINHSINDDKVAYNYVGRIFGEGDEVSADFMKYMARVLNNRCLLKFKKY